MTDKPSRESKYAALMPAMPPPMMQTLAVVSPVNGAETGWTWSCSQMDSLRPDVSAVESSSLILSFPMPCTVVYEALRRAVDWKEPLH